MGYLEREGLVWRNERVPMKLPLELLPVLTVDKLVHRLVHHIRLHTRKQLAPIGAPHQTSHMGTVSSNM